jgi:hypothetical protein
MRHAIPAMSTANLEIAQLAANTWDWLVEEVPWQGSTARNLGDSSEAELAQGDDLLQSTDWLDRMLARRLVASVVMVAGLASVFALAM